MELAAEEITVGRHEKYRVIFDQLKELDREFFVLSNQIERISDLLLITRTSLPRQAVRHARRIFSTRSDVPDSAIGQVRANWSSSPNLPASEWTVGETG